MILLEELPLPSHVATRLTLASLLCASVDVGLVHFQHILFKLCDIFGVVNIPLKLEGTSSKYINVLKDFDLFQTCLSTLGVLFGLALEGILVIIYQRRCRFWPWILEIAISILLRFQI